MKPYKIALLTGTHQHRWPDDGSGVCEKCHKEHSPHKYLSGNPGVCTICGAEGKCPHSGGFVTLGDTQHRCSMCYASLEHSLVKVTTENQCAKCSACGQIINSHQFSGGVCGVCDYACQHSWQITANQHACKICDVEELHAWQNNAEKTLCQTCTVCGYQRRSHTFSGGVCSVCNYVCDHDSLIPVDGIAHECARCHNFAAFHEWIPISGNAEDCAYCKDCYYWKPHQGITGLGDACTVCGTVHSKHVWSQGTCKVCGAVHSEHVWSQGTCTVCGAVHSTHIWSQGTCKVCGAGCTHDSINSNGKCTMCGMMMKKPGTSYYFYGGTVYDGSYGDADVHYTNEAKTNCYTVYKGYEWNAASGTWIANGYYFFSFEITHEKTMFGGDYAYKLTGGVFSTSSTTVNVSPALLSANGVYKLKLAQYEQDGTFKASSMSGYTSADCSFNAVSSPAWPSWTA